MSGAVNWALTISVLTPLTKGLGPALRSVGRRLAAFLAFVRVLGSVVLSACTNITIPGARAPGRGPAQGSRVRVLRRRQPAFSHCVGALAVMLALATPHAVAQSPPSLDSFLLRPEVDGDPRMLPRFRRPGAAPEAAPSRLGAVPSFDYRAGRGAGNTGFDSSGAPKTKDKGKAKSKTAPKTAAVAAPSAAGLPKAGIAAPN